MSPLRSDRYAIRMIFLATALCGACASADRLTGRVEPEPEATPELVLFEAVVHDLAAGAGNPRLRVDPYPVTAGARRYGYERPKVPDAVVRKRAAALRHLGVTEANYRRDAACVSAFPGTGRSGRCPHRGRFTVAVLAHPTTTGPSEMTTRVFITSQSGSRVVDFVAAQRGNQWAIVRRDTVFDIQM